MSRPLSEEDLAALRSGVVITTLAQRDRGPAKALTAATLPCAVERADRPGDQPGRVVLMTLREGRNRQIRRMMEALGHSVDRLHRERVLGIGLSGLRQPGEWASLAPGEMRHVRQAVWAALLAKDRAGASGPGSDASPAAAKPAAVAQQQQVEKGKGAGPPAAGRRRAEFSSLYD